MTIDLRYGASKTLCLTPTEEQSVQAHSIAIESLDHALNETIHKSLDTSVHFPAFKEIVFPEDTLAISVGQGVPQVAKVISCILDYIQTSTAVSPNDITIVFANEQEALAIHQLEALLDEFLLSSLTMEVHNPDISEDLAYLTATAEGDPIRLNKTLVDADVVLPICSNLPDSLFGHAGFFHDLFPLFTETETILRFRSQQDAASLTRDAIEAANMLGVQYLVKVTPANDDEIHDITAGDTYTLQTTVPAIAKQVWQRPHSPADLCIGSISGPPHHQTWDNFARALSGLAKSTNPGGSIVICSELEGPLPAPIKFLSSNDATDRLREQLRQQPDVNIQAAQEILRLKTDYHLYLLSSLDGDDVESIGLAHIESPDQVNNLISSADSITIVGDAHRATVE